MNVVERIRKGFPQVALAMDQVPETFRSGWLHDAASAEVDLDDFGPDFYSESLDRLCRSLNEDADLNEYGRLVMTMALRGQLVNRLLLQRMRKVDPDCLSGPVPAPIIVTGLPRTGTTFLHRFLAADPAHVSLPLWQLNRPVPRNDSDTPEARRAVIDDLIGLRRQITPELDSVHLSRPDSPEECMWLSASSMLTRLWFNLAPVHSWLYWYVRADKTGRYREYAELLTFLQADYPGRQMVLKSPDHLDGLVELMETLPEARVICTHRDMIRQFGSYLSLGRATKTIATHRLDPAAEAWAAADMFDQSILHMENARARFADRMIDIRYADMMADPLGTIEQIYDFAGLKLGDNRRQSLRDYHQNNPKNKHGKHTYTLDEFGISEDWVRNHYLDYSTRFVG
ncbi:MAG: sulfotransferase family protein [Paracoccus sp. (in: a-proteobacteria)]